MNSKSNNSMTSQTGREEKIINSDSQPVIIFLHGAVVNRKMWRPHLNLLSQDYNILAPDLPGHGSVSDQSFTVSGSVEYVIELINELDGRPVILVGDSLGGYVAMAAAGEYPEKISALIVSGCTKNYMGVLGFLLKFNAKMGQWVINILGEDRLAGFTKKKLQKKINPELVDEIFDEGVRISSRMEALTGLINRNFSSSLASFDKPVLFINGEKDRINRWGEEDFIKGVANARLKTIGNADHFMALTHPEKYVEAITSFLNEENITA